MYPGLLQNALKVKRTMKKSYDNFLMYEVHLWRFSCSYSMLKSEHWENFCYRETWTAQNSDCCALQNIQWLVEKGDDAKDNIASHSGHVTFHFASCFEQVTLLLITSRIAKWAFLVASWNQFHERILRGIMIRHWNDLTFPIKSVPKCYRLILTTFFRKPLHTSFKRGNGREQATPHSAMLLHKSGWNLLLNTPT